MTNITGENIRQANTWGAAMALSETIGAKLTTISATMEDIHYDPEVCDQKALEDLTELLGLIATAEDIAHDLTQRLGLGN